MLIVFAVILILLLINALYVSAEFATLSARRARLAQMAEEGNRLARLILPIVEDPRQLDTYIAACQLGITLSSLMLGFYAQRALGDVVAPWLTRLGGLAPAAAASIAATAVLLVLTGFQVIIGELVPKNIGVRYPERLALLTAVPMRWSILLFQPLIWLFNGSGQLLLRLMGMKPAAEHTHIHSPEEIAILVQESGIGGLLDRQERRLIENTLWLRNASVRQMMVPRTRVLAAPVDQPCEELFTLLANSPFSRLPLFEGSIDNVVGVVHLKELLCLRQASRPPAAEDDSTPRKGAAAAEDNARRSRVSGRLQDSDGRETAAHSVREVMAPALFIPETLTADEAFALLQQKRYHVAIVLDEYGGTAGIITLEDLIEEIFGELQDEFDQEVPPFRALPGNRVVVRWDWLVEELNELLGLALPSEQADTIGGLVLNELGHLPQVGDQVKFGPVSLRVERVEGNAVSAVSLSVTPDQVEQLREATA